MSTRNKILLGIVGLIAVSVILRYVVGGPFAAGPPHVSVRAEPVFYIDGSGVHLGVPHDGGYVITNSMIMAVLVSIVLFVLSILATRNLQLVPSGFQNFVEIAVDGMYNTFGSIDRKYIARFWPLIGTVFFYVLVSNWLALIPGILSVGYSLPASELEHASGTPAATDLLAYAGTFDEQGVNAAPVAAEPNEMVVVPYLRSPSADLSNTLMLAVVAFFFIEYWGFKVLGGGYLTKFFPFKDGVIAMIVGFFELIGEFSRVLAFAFRLFGNIFAGEVLLLVMVFLFPLLPLPFIGFELFVGFIQAFVFAVLMMAFGSLATQAHGDHGEHPHEPTHAEVGGTVRQNPVH